MSQLLLQSFYEERGGPAEAPHDDSGDPGSERQPLRPKEELLDSLASGDDDDATAGSSHRRYRRHERRMQSCATHVMISQPRSEGKMLPHLRT